MAIIFNDAFNRSNASTLGGSWAGDGTTGILNNKAFTDCGYGGNGVALTLTSDYVVRATFSHIASGETPRINFWRQDGFVFVGVEANADSYKIVGFNFDDGGVIHASSMSVVPADGDTLTITVNYTTKVADVYLNGVAAGNKIITWTLNGKYPMENLTGAGIGGSGTGSLLDDFYVSSSIADLPGIGASGTPGAVSYATKQSIYGTGNTSYATRQRISLTSSVVYATKQAINSVSSVPYATKQSLYSTGTVSYATRQVISDTGSPGSVSYATRQVINNLASASFATQQRISQVGSLPYATQQRISQVGNVAYATKQLITAVGTNTFATRQVLYGIQSLEFYTKQMFYTFGSVQYGTRQTIYDPTLIIQGAIPLKASRDNKKYLQATRTLGTTLHASRRLHITLKGEIPVAAKEQNFEMFAGDSEIIAYPLTEAGEPVPLGGAGITWFLHRARSDIKLVTKTVGDGIVITNADNGEFTVTLNPEDTELLVGVYDYRITVTDATGFVSTVALGRVTILP